MERRQSTMEISKKSVLPSNSNPITQLQTHFKEVETGFNAWLAKQASPVDATVVTFMRSGAVPPPNPITQLQTRFKELETGFKAWLAKQPSHVVESFIWSAVGGPVTGTIVGAYARVFINKPLKSRAWSPFLRAHAHKIACLYAFNYGIFSHKKRTKDIVDELQTSPSSAKILAPPLLESVTFSMVAAFGSGAMFSLVMGFGGPNKVASAVRSGLLFALAQGFSDFAGELVDRNEGQNN